MRGRHIALFPLPSKGHIHPYLGLCPELIRRGYRVTLVTDRYHESLVSSAGAEAVVVETSKTYGEPPATNGWDGNDPRWWDLVGGFILPSLLHSTSLAVWQLDQFYKKNRPDVIIYDKGANAGRILAKRLEVPSIQYYYDFVYHSGHFCWEDGVGYCPAPILEFTKLLDSVLWAHDLERSGNFWHIEEMNICPLPREFQFDIDAVDSRRLCFVGPFLDRPFKPSWTNRSNGKRIVLVSAITGSTDADYFNTIIEALSGSDYHVILSTGEHFPTSKLVPLPENFEINRSVSHLEILPHADVHLYSGGAVGTLEGFYFGVPLIAVPTFGPNYKVAQRLSSLGFALTLLLSEVTDQSVRGAIETALHDNEFRRRATHMQSVVRSQGGSGVAVDRIERYLAERA